MQNTALADKARAKFDALIEKGKSNAISAIESLQASVPKDAIVPAGAMKFRARAPGAVELCDARIESGGSPIHRHALGQIAERTKVLPPKYARELLAIGRADVLARDLNDLYREPKAVKPSARFLVRSVQGEVRGVLSDKFKRLDSAPIVEAFIGGMRRHGAVPIEARNADTKFWMQVALATTVEPIPGEIMLYGATISNSDFGDGKLSLKAWLLRLWCVNGATAEDLISQVHLGRRLSENLHFSQRTYDLDTRAMSSAVTDVMDNIFDADRVREKMELVRAAHEEKIDAGNQLTSMRRRNLLTKGEAERVAELYNSAEIELLPPGNTAWRLSNAISLLANDETVAPERKLDLQGVAGGVAKLAA